MDVLVVTGLGVLTVLLSILVIRLHPFLSLLLGTLVVVVLTPESCRILNRIETQSAILEESSADFNLRLARQAAPGEYFLWRQQHQEPDAEVWRLHRIEPSLEDTQGHLYRVDEIPGIAMPSAGDRLVPKDVYVDAKRRASVERFEGIVDKLSSGLAGTFQKIGLAICMAAIIGVCLLESGAAQRVVEGLGRWLGTERTAPVLVVSGFLLGIPIFFDTVFYLLLPLAKAFGRSRPKQVLLAVMSIIVGATMAHSLIPPTPGPLLVASQLNVPLGVMILGGAIVGGVATLVGYLYSRWCNDKWGLPLDSAVFFPANAVASSSNEQIPASDQASERISKRLPLAIAVLPLAFPIMSLGGYEFARSLEIFDGLESGSPTEKLSGWLGFFNLLGKPSFVLMVSAVMAYALLRRVASARNTLPLMNKAIADAGTIILLTSAGGAFGAALQELRLAEVITVQFKELLTPSGVLLSAFGLTALIRVAQGSATVAMITSVAIVAPIVTHQNLPYHPVYIALAIGCGAKLLPWMNDSGFWQVSTMTGMTAGQTIKTFSVALTLMGCAGFLVVLAGAAWMPFR